MNKINKISIFENIRSDYLLKKIFNNLKENKLLNIIKYNKYIQCTACELIYDTVEEMTKHYNDIHEKNRNFTSQNNNIYNKYGKRPLREEERIVTNEYLQNINHMKKMEKSKDLFRTKSANGIRQTHRKNPNNNPKIKRL